MRPTTRRFGKLLVMSLMGAASAAGACPGSISFAENATAEELLVRLFKRSGDSFLIEPGISGDHRIRVSLSGAPLELVLKRICESADLAWNRNGNVYVIGPNRTSDPVLTQLVRNTSPHLWMGPHLFRQVFGADLSRVVLGLPELHLPSASALPLSGSVMFNDGGRYYSARAATEDRSTFSCPHCRRSVTIVGKNQSCAKCGRGFQRDWGFCPFDGARRVAPLDEWKVCPFCTRGVK